MKQLKYITVNAEQYYSLLEWKDTNFHKFDRWVKVNNIGGYSINYFTQSEYDRLVALVEEIKLYQQ